MSYTDYWLKAPDKATFDAVVPTYEMGGQIIEAGWAGVNIDRVGVLYDPTGEFVDVDGLSIPIMVPTEGYYANVRVAAGASLPAALQVFLIAEPSTPARVWAGDQA